MGNKGVNYVVIVIALMLHTEYNMYLGGELVLTLH